MPAHSTRARDSTERKGAPPSADRAKPICTAISEIYRQGPNHDLGSKGEGDGLHTVSARLAGLFSHATLSPLEGGRDTVNGEQPYGSAGERVITKGFVGGWDLAGHGTSLCPCCSFGREAPKLAGVRCWGGAYWSGTGRDSAEGTIELVVLVADLNRANFWGRVAWV